MTANLSPLDDVVAERYRASDDGMRGILLDTQQWALVRQRGREVLRPLNAVPAKHAKRIIVRGVPLLTVPHNTHDRHGGALEGLAYFPKDAEVNALRAAAGVLLSSGLLSVDVSREAHISACRLLPDSILNRRSTRFVRGLRKGTTLLYLHDSADGAGQVVGWQQHIDRVELNEQVMRERFERNRGLEQQAQAACDRLDAWLEGQGSTLRADKAYGFAERQVMPSVVVISGDLLHVLAEHAAARTPA